MKPINFLIPALILALTGACSNYERDENGVNVVPLPNHTEILKGRFILTDDIAIRISDGEESIEIIAHHLADRFKEYYNIQLNIRKGTENIQDGKCIILSLQKDIITGGSEGYELDVEPDQIRIHAQQPAGIFYGVQTLLQLVNIKGNLRGQELWVPAVKIIDSPRFSWRGMHLDVSRHFFDTAFIKKYIDILAAHKMNVFHWHLTDDQGWRIEIKKYPELTGLASWRTDKTGQPWDYDQEITNDPEKDLYGGFYTQDEIREIVRYAKERFITIIPEIEMPCHSQAALTAYPQLSCAGKPYRMPDDVPFEFTDPYCPGNDSTFIFLEDVLSEVIALFPSEYIHVGGDEAKKTPWLKCPKCKALMKKEGIETAEELQSYFIRRIEKFLSGHGRKLIGWDEILEGGLAPDAAVMSWRGEEGGLEAARQGHKAVMTPGDYLYFNRNQDVPDQALGHSGNGLSIKQVYEFNPIPDELGLEQVGYILGAQACLWTENVETPEQAEYQLLPRLCALAEIAWTANENKDYSGFSDRMEEHYAYLDYLRVNYYIQPPKGLGDRVFYLDDAEVLLSSDYDNTEIRYTMDGTEPDRSSQLYSVPIKVKNSSVILARTFLPSGKASRVKKGTFKKEQLRDCLEDTSGIKKGLQYRYFEGNIVSCFNFDKMILKDSGTVESFIVPGDVTKDHFGYEFTGLVKISADGIYTFYTDSDDGSLLFIDDELLINNDGIHGANLVSGQIPLAKGYHRIRVLFFEDRFGQHLHVYISGPGEVMHEIKGDMLY